ncbi:MAG: hypothetical protein M3276_08990, partial [Actinomycetota bacterium]|nr:hypothetical protein [Actinomycetota bacterium]
AGDNEAVDESAASPPPVQGPLRMFLSHERFPTKGGVLAFAVVNHDGAEFAYGVGGSFDRWDGGEWQPHRRFVSSLTGWSRAGSVYDPGDPIGIPDIGLVAAAGQTGSLEWLQLPRLEPGWYRLTHNSSDSDRVAAGIIEVSAQPGTLAPDLTGPGEQPILGVQPFLLPAGQHEIRVVATAPSINTADQAAAFDATLAPTVALQHWVDGGWETLTVLPVDTSPQPPVRNTKEVAVTLPALDTGAYRLLRDSTAVAPLPGHLWVTDLLR